MRWTGNFSCSYFLKRDDWKEGIYLNTTLVNLAEEKMSSQHPTPSPKLCSDTSTSENSSYCFNKQASLDEKILQILDDLLNLFQGSEIRPKVLRYKLTSLFKIATLHLKVD